MTTGQATETAAPPDADAASTTADADADGGLRCYRHPDRETYVRCGRCDRPICPSCSMQGPVGFRCRSCGKPAIDPLTSLSARQAILGALVATGGGTVGALIGLQIGWFIIFIGFFAGGLIADAVMRFTGFKRGPRMATVLLGGIAVGTLLALGVDYLLVLGVMDAGAAAEAYPFLAYVYDVFAWALVFAGAAMAGAWGRLRI